jgi:hypothetical protein
MVHMYVDRHLIPLVCIRLISSDLVLSPSPFVLPLTADIGLPLPSPSLTPTPRADLRVPTANVTHVSCKTTFTTGAHREGLSGLLSTHLCLVGHPAGSTSFATRQQLLPLPSRTAAVILSAVSATAVDLSPILPFSSADSAPHRAHLAHCQFLLPSTAASHVTASATANPSSHPVQYCHSTPQRLPPALPHIATMFHSCHVIR